MDNVNLIGYLATALTLISFCFKDIKKLRLIGLISCIVWIIYGFIKKENPVIFVNTSIIIIHSYYLIFKKC